MSFDKCVQLCNHHYSCVNQIFIIQIIIGKKGVSQRAEGNVCPEVTERKDFSAPNNCFFLCSADPLSVTSLFLPLLIYICPFEQRGLYHLEDGKLLPLLVKLTCRGNR